MSVFRIGVLALLFLAAAACQAEHDVPEHTEAVARGPYSVGSTSMAVSARYADIGDGAMHDYLLGRPNAGGETRYVADLLAHPDAAWIVDVPVPDEPAIYGPASGLSMPVVSFLAFPSMPATDSDGYAFPYHDARYGVFENMLGPGEAPEFADPGARFPLVILAHGASAHGIYDVRHAHTIASHGFIVVVLFYGDDRTGVADSPNHHVSYLRPLLTKAVLDSVLDSEAFGPRVDSNNIGISGHSFGGYTALALAGGPYLGNPSTVRDERIDAAVIAAPWVGHVEGGEDFHAFGPGNAGLSRVTIPVLGFFGTEDQVTLASFILPAMQRLSGPTYVVELIGQPHVFEGGSWIDRDNWELLFFSAYLKDDPASIAKLTTAGSMPGGNDDRQLFDYQRSTRQGMGPGRQQAR